MLLSDPSTARKELSALLVCCLPLPPVRLGFAGCELTDRRPQGLWRSVFVFWSVHWAGLSWKPREMLLCKAWVPKGGWGRAAGWDEETPSLESDTYSEPLSTALERKRDRKVLFLGSLLSQSVPGHTYSWPFAFVCLSLALTCFLPLSNQPSRIYFCSHLF